MMNIGWVSPPLNNSAGTQITKVTTERIGRPANRIDNGGNKRAMR